MSDQDLKVIKQKAINALTVAIRDSDFEATSELMNIVDLTVQKIIAAKSLADIQTTFKNLEKEFDNKEFCENLRSAAAIEEATDLSSMTKF